MDIVVAIVLGILIYTIVCFFIAVIRALFSKSEKRKDSFKETFWTFFLEVLNPLHWF